MDTSSVRFGEFLLDPARRELWHGDERLQPPARVFDCIAYLVAHRDRAVSRDELFSAIWGNADISDNMLDQTVLRARRILDDTGDQRRIILTQPRFGYLWGISAEVVEPEQSLPGEHSTPLAKRRRWLWPAMAAAVTLLVVVVFFVARPHLFSPERAAHTARALVLPVAVEAGPEYAWVRLGLMDLVAERLRAAGLTVVPSDNVVALLQGRDAFSDAEIEDAAGVADASLVIKTQAQSTQGRWRVTLRWSQGDDPESTTAGEASDILAAARIATDIMARRLNLVATPPVSPPADEAIAGLLQQVEAAILAEDMDGARALLGRLDKAQRQRPDVRYQHAIVDFRSGRLKAAQTALEALLESDAVRQDKVFHTRVLNGLSNVLLRRGDVESAARHTDAAVVLLEDGAPTRELGRALTGRAITHSSQNRYRAALADFARARVILESIGDRFALARVNANIGILENRRDRLAEALPMLAESADSLKAFHDLSSELFTRVSLLYAQLALRDPVSALAGESRLNTLISREPDAARRRYAQLARAQILAANGRLSEADELLRRVSADAEDAGDSAVLAWARAVRAERKLDEGEFGQALGLSMDALAVDWEDEQPRAYARAWLTRVRARLSLDQAELAIADAAAMRAWAGTSQARVAQIYAALADAEVAGDDAGDDNGAATTFEHVLSEAESGRVPDDLLRVSESYADYLIRHDRLRRAGEVIARTSDWADRDYTAALLQLRLYHALAQPSAWHHALARAETLAGERRIPFQWSVIPTVKD